MPLFCKEDPVLSGQVTEKQGAEKVWLPPSPRQELLGGLHQLKPFQEPCILELS